MRAVSFDVADGTESLSLAFGWKDVASTAAGRSVGWEGDE